MRRFIFAGILAAAVVFTAWAAGVKYVGTFVGDGAGLTNLNTSGLSPAPWTNAQWAVIGSTKTVFDGTNVNANGLNTKIDIFRDTDTDYLRMRAAGRQVGVDTDEDSTFYLTAVRASLIVESPGPGNAAGFEITTNSTIFTGPVVGLFYGDAVNLTNIPLSGLQVIPLTNNQSTATTFSNAVYSGASSASTAPASDEFPTAQWVRSLFNSGTLFYSSTNLATGYTNSDYPNIFYAITNIPPSGVRGYTNTALTAGNYLGTIVTTNRFTQINGPVAVDAYLGLTSAGSPNVSVHPELYYSYDKTNWLGDWSAGNQTLVLARTNLYQWVINIPTTTSTNSTGFYLARRFKVGASSGLVATTIAWAFQGTNSISGTDAASHFSIAGPNSILGNAYLPNTQTFTGSNTFTGGIWGKLIAPTKYIGSTNYTIGAVESIYFADGTNQIVTLPLAPTTGTMITVIATTTTGSVILTNANGSQTICGGLNQTIYQTNRLTVVFDGTNYW